MSDDGGDLFGLSSDGAEFQTRTRTRGSAALGFLGVCLGFAVLLGVVVGAFLAFWFLLYGSASVDVVGWWIFNQAA